jgi:hypothetical protein
MPLAYVIDRGQRLVVITGEYADDGQWRALLQRIAHDPDHEPGFSFLRDLRSAKHPVDPSTVMRIISVVREFWALLQVRRAAIVTPRDQDTPALVAHALAQDEQIPLQAFTSYNAAVEWLNAPVKEGER